MKIAIRIFVGIVFIVSAIFKILSIDTFEIYVYSFGLLALNTAFLFSRLLISFELLLGALLIIGIYRKVSILTSILLLIGFTGFIVSLLIQNNPEHCHCFGAQVNLSHPWSIAKNIALIILLIIAFERKEWKHRLKPLLLAILIVCSVAVPFVISTPDNFSFEQYAKSSSYQKDLLDDFLSKNQLHQEKVILCFFSSKCEFCRLAAKKISTIDNRVENQLNIKYVLWDSEEEESDFFEETFSNKYPFISLNPFQFIQITNGKMPLILLIDQGQVIEKYGYRDLDEAIVKDFIP